MITWLFATAAIVVLLSYIFGRPSIKDVEQRIRHIVALCYIWKWKRSNCPLFPYDRHGVESVHLGIRALPEAIKREHPRELSPDIHAMDGVGFAGTSNEGHALVVRISRRQDRCSEVIVYLKLTSGEEYELPEHPDCHVYNTDGKTFSAAGLTFEVLHPLLRWRITFNGSLRRRTDDGPQETVPVRFNFIWKPMNDHIAFPHDLQAGILASQLVQQQIDVTGLLGSISKVLKDKEWHEQFGMIHGTMNIGDQEEAVLIMRGLKDRKNGIQDWSEIACDVSIKGVTSHGSPFHLFATKNKTGKSLVYGYVCAPCNSIIRHVNEWSADITKLAGNDKFGLSFKAGDRQYELEMTKSDAPVQLFHGDDWNIKNDIRIIKFRLNGKSGFGIIENMAPHSGHNPLLNRKSLPQLTEPVIESIEQQVLTFDDVECRSSKFVGGKGASLALMSSITNQGGWQPIKFKVPRGVCLTRVSFDRHLRDNSALRKAITELENVAWKKTQGSLEDECERIVALMHQTRVSSALKDQLQKSLKRALGSGDFEQYKFAVRSSAIGEDSEELSAAGQNETFLGVKGLEEICSAVIKCWASQFTFRSIEYRRQNGQVLNGGMAVVVQKMVPADVAGVLFTNHPVTGSRAYMFISSNYGLGESVVSASADPDTILLNRERNDHLSIAEKRVGKKALKISMSETGGVVESAIDADDASECTLSDKMAIKLAKIAIHLEKSWGTSRDIEWALIGEDIYLLQSRPVTTDIMLTDFELQHEFDTAMRTDTEWFSNANLGEVMPGAMSPLQLTGVYKILVLCMEKLITWKYLRQRYDPSIVDMFLHMYNHAFMNRIHEKFFALSETKSDAAKASEIGLYGRVIDDDDIMKMAIERADKPPSTATFGLQKQMFKGFFFGGWIIEKAEKRFGQYPALAQNATSVREAYDIIDKHFTDVEAAFFTHITVTYKSTVCNLIVLNCLAQQNKDYGLDQYMDFATLTTGSNGTESGDVPYSLRELAKVIAKDIEPTKFSKMTIQDGLKWITENKQESQSKFKEFLRRHGHRGYKEFDVSSKTWDMQPENVIKVLQDTLRNPVPAATAQNTKKQQAVNPIDNLKTPLTSFKKKILAWALKGAKSGVRHREMGKSLTCKVIAGLRKGYRQLAHLMVAEGMLPDEDLLPFLTHEEIGQLIETRSAKLIRRAKQRRRMHSIMDTYKYEEMFHGYAVPIDANKKDVKVDSLTQVTGYPVCQGVVQGPARVINSFDQVHLIQPGDILITHATDICWSPYFPMLAGVVTEIGGLVSHGAVVAREFGLPCMVGAHNATDVFKSGEIVLLNANKGIIAKVTE